MTPVTSFLSGVNIMAAQPNDMVNYDLYYIMRMSSRKATARMMVTCEHTTITVVLCMYDSTMVKRNSTMDYHHHNIVL